MAALLYDWVGLPLVVGAIYADKDRQEETLKASGLDWTIIRPTLLTNGPRTGTYRGVTNLTGFHGGRISRADCAECMLQALTERAPGWERPCRHKLNHAPRGAACERADPEPAMRFLLTATR